MIKAGAKAEKGIQLDAFNGSYNEAVFLTRAKSSNPRWT